MPETLEELVMMQPPTPERPLLGTIVLAVEDSRHSCEALRLICQRSGARIRRAASLTAAKRHLQTYRPRIAVIDLGLPDGSGLELIETLANSDSRIEGIIATSGDDTLSEAALLAGADVFLPKPLASVVDFQKTALELLSGAQRELTVMAGPADSVEPDPIALRDDLSLAAELLRSGADQATIDYVATFLSGLAKSANAPHLSDLSERVRALPEEDGDPSRAAVALAIEDEMAALEPV